MRTVPKEIVYEETACGLFAPKPTRAQKRAAKQAAELRRQTREEWSVMIGAVLLCVLLTGVSILPYVRW